MLINTTAIIMAGRFLNNFTNVTKAVALVGISSYALHERTKYNQLVLEINEFHNVMADPIHKLLNDMEQTKSDIDPECFNEHRVKYANECRRLYERADLHSEMIFKKRWGTHKVTKMFAKDELNKIVDLLNELSWADIFMRQRWVEPGIKYIQIMHNNKPTKMTISYDEMQMKMPYRALIGENVICNLKQQLLTPTLPYNVSPVKTTYVDKYKSNYGIIESMLTHFETNFKETTNVFHRGNTGFIYNIYKTDVTTFKESLIDFIKAYTPLTEEDRINQKLLLDHLTTHNYLFVEIMY
jgi:hypothetical protein